MLAERATEIIGRLDSAASGLSTYVGLQAGRVRVATFASALITLLPRTAAVLAVDHPGIELELTDTHPPEALQMLRAGEVDVAIMFSYAEAPDDDVRLIHLLDDPTYLLVPCGDEGRTLADHRDARWIAGCERYRENLLHVCAREGFVPRIACSTDDVAAIQALVAAGLGVAVIPGLALDVHRHPGLEVIEVPGSTRHAFAATYGAPPDPPPTRAFLDAMVRAVRRRADDRDAKLTR